MCTMKKFKIVFTTCILILSFISCSVDDIENESDSIPIEEPLATGDEDDIPDQTGKD